MHQGGPLKGVQPPALGTGGARVDDVIDSLEDVDSANLLALTLVILSALPLVIAHLHLHLYMLQIPASLEPYG